MRVRKLRRPLRRNKRNPLEFLAVVFAIALVGVVSAASITFKSGYFTGQTVAWHVAR